jgi:hypothetical protein
VINQLPAQRGLFVQQSLSDPVVSQITDSGYSYKLRKLSIQKAKLKINVTHHKRAFSTSHSSPKKNAPRKKEKQ